MLTTLNTPGSLTTGDVSQGFRLGRLTTKAEKRKTIRFGEVAGRGVLTVAVERYSRPN